MIENKLRLILLILFIVLLILLGVLIVNSQSFSAKKYGFISSIRSIKDKDKTVAFYSDVPGHELALTKSDYLNDRLNEVAFWNNSNVDIFLNPTSPLHRADRVNKLRVYITTDPQPFNKTFIYYKNKKSNLFQSFGMRFSEKEKIVSIYTGINTDVLKSVSAEAVNAEFSEMLLSLLWRATHRAASGQPSESKFDGLNNYIESLKKLPFKTFVSIK